MPIYEYSCKKCQKNFEEIVFNTDEIPPCPYCQSTETQKLISQCRHSSGSAFNGDFSTGSSGGSGCAGCSGGSCSTCK